MFNLKSKTKIMVFLSFICFFLGGSWKEVSGMRTASAKVTQGDALAVFNALISGGTAIRLHSPQIQGNPAQAGPNAGVATRPFCPWEGKHYCQTDWHVLMISFLDGPTEDFCPNLTHSDVQAEMATLDNKFIVDGVEVDTMRTPLKRATADKNLWAISDGVLYAPGELSVGPHTFSVESTGTNFAPDPDNPGECALTETTTATYPISIPDVCEDFPSFLTFYIDAPGTGACVD